MANKFFITIIALSSIAIVSAQSYNGNYVARENGLIHLTVDSAMVVITTSSLVMARYLGTDTMAICRYRETSNNSISLTSIVPREEIIESIDVSFQYDSTLHDSVRFVVELSNNCG